MQAVIQALKAYPPFWKADQVGAVMTVTEAEAAQAVKAGVAERARLADETPPPPAREDGMSWFRKMGRDDRGPGMKHVEYNVKTALNTAYGSQGGFLIPPTLNGRVLGVVAEKSVVRPRALVLQSRTVDFAAPVVDLTAVSAGLSAFLGGLQLTWPTDGNALGQTTPGFKLLNMPLNLLAGYVTMSNAVFDGGLSGLNDEGMQAFLGRLIGQAVAWFEDYAFLRGSGLGQPLGILKSGSLISVTRSGTGAVTEGDLHGMLARLLPQSFENAMFALHPTVWAKMLAAGLIQAYADATGRVRHSIIGIPAHCTEKLPALGTAGDILLMDPSFYVICDKAEEDSSNVEIALAVSRELKFTTNQTDVRVVKLAAGQPLVSGTLTLADGSTTCSPFVCLAA